MILLTWNRDFENVWPINEYESARKKIISGNHVAMQWSTARNKKIPLNSEVYFFVQGQKYPRGLIAKGFTTSQPKLGQHWNDPKKLTNYVKIKYLSY